MGELVQAQVIDPSVNEPVSLAEQTPDNLLKMIDEGKQNLAKETQETPDLIIEPQAQTPAPVQADKVPEGQPQAPAVPVQQPAVKGALDDLMAKKGFHTPEDLAKSYKELERQFHAKRQEESRALRQPIIPAPVPAQPAEQIPPVQLPVTPGLPIGYSREQFIADFEADPLRTVATISQIINAPLYQAQKDTALHSKVIELSSSPKTAEFNLPIVQQEMTRIFTERPDYQNNVLGSLEDCFDKAVSNLYREGKLTKDSVEVGKKMAEQNFVQKQAAAVETSGKPQIPQPNSIWQAPADKQWEMLNQLWLQEREKVQRGI